MFYSTFDECTTNDNSISQLQLPVAIVVAVVRWFAFMDGGRCVNRHLPYPCVMILL
jgi:hypothetical protein